MRELTETKFRNIKQELSKEAQLERTGLVDRPLHLFSWSGYINTPHPTFRQLPFETFIGSSFDADVAEGSVSYRHSTNSLVIRETAMNRSELNEFAHSDGTVETWYNYTHINFNVYEFPLQRLLPDHFHDRFVQWLKDNQIQDGNSWHYSENSSPKSTSARKKRKKSADRRSQPAAIRQRQR